jgi:pimeloyl-ACP methyl ester carboxylesterase
MNRRTSLSTLALLALVLLSSSASLAQTAADSSHPKAERVSRVGTLRVERYGSGSPALIFIPGLACGSWIWSDAVNAYAGSHTVYLVTLAGFDGVPLPTAEGSPLDLADASLLALITNENLDRPILVGHSMGGFLALRFGEEHAALLRGVVAVDYGPVFAPAAQSSPEDRATLAEDLAREMATEPAARYADSQNATIATMVTDPTNADRIDALTARSDQKAVAAYAGDLFRSDLRPQLSQLTVPTLEIAAVPTVPQGFEGPQAAKTPITQREAAYKDFYTTLFPDAPNVTVVTVPNSKHYVMIDQPKALFDAITAFVAGLR